ncbi:MAG: haloacid dehalogenase-like hydrolase [Deltaproteobacteria bacterium]|nr:haloacid dehalogenase-like hydrolase [Deltaproteobacteria bacterium]
MSRRIRTGWWVVLWLVVVVAPAAAAGAADPLPSWRDGPARRAILRFVAAVTRPGSPDFVPRAERIATFDNDGTLMAEKPEYFQLYFIIERIRELAPQHPEWKEQPPFATVLADDGDDLTGLSRADLERLVLASSANLSEKEYVASIERFLDHARNPELGLPFPKTVYKPMLELLDFLRARGFRIFVCSAAGPEMIRGFSEKTYGVPRENVIGSDMQMRYELDGAMPVLMREPNFTPPTNDRGGKPINIDRVVGRSPILAFGNSDGDIEMLEFAAYSGRPHLALLLRHDDAEREFAYDEGAEQALALAPDRGWIVVSMRESFRRVFATPPPRQREAR